MEAMDLTNCLNRGFEELPKVESDAAVDGDLTSGKAADCYRQVF
jgi:hypothetical protein